jgi:hypothetical protein
MQEVTAPPEPPPAHLVHSDEGEALHPLDRGVTNSLRSSWVVAADHQTFPAAADQTVVVGKLVFLSHGTSGS